MIARVGIRTALVVFSIAATLMFSACSSSCGDGGDPSRAFEEEAWRRASEDVTIESLESYLAAHPSGEHSLLAKRALKDLWAEEVELLEPVDIGRMTAVIETNRGVIRFEFFAGQAPETCKNFIRLAKSHFYDGLVFHRVVDGYLIQTGCPEGSGHGNPGYTIEFEEGARTSSEGMVGMARLEDSGSAGSQFFITLSAQPKLSRQYTVFGQVIDGMEVVRAIGSVETAGERPVEKQFMTRVNIEGL